MQIQILVREESLEELAHFLRADIKYQHTISWYPSYTENILSFPVHKVSLFYDDFVMLRDMQMNTDNTKSRTKED